MSKLSTEERLQKEIVRISKRKERNIKAYQKSMFKKFIGYHIVTVFQVIVAIVLTLIAMFSLWNHFNPTQDYLYFIVIYAVFGNMLNMIYFGIAGERLKRYKNMNVLDMNGIRIGQKCKDNMRINPRDRVYFLLKIICFTTQY